MAGAHEVTLTREQQSCVDYDGAALLVRGEAGSGKSLVLLRQAMKKVMEDPAARVLIFTFNKTLAKFARELLAQAEAETGVSFARIQVLHFHGWAWGTLRDAGHKPNVIKEKDQKELVDQVIAKLQKQHPRVNVLKRDRDFFMDEFAWLKGKQIGSLVDYAMADRKGRGAALRVQDRQHVWEAFSAYQAGLAARHQLDWHDFAPELLKRAAKIPASRRADWVMVDEAQDLQVAQVRLLKEIAAKGVTIAADEGQRIYKAHFTWREVGIKIDASNSKRLTTSFRSTKQIVALAASLRARDPEANAEGAVEFRMPEAEDALPQLWTTDSDLKEEEVILGLIQELQAEDPEAAVGLLARTWRPLYRIRHLLGEHGIPYEIVEGEDGSITTPGVKLTTFHSAKGLEFDFAILCRLNDDVTPGKLVDGVEEELEAAEILAVERRLLYVSMTRAKQRLYMTHGSNPSRLLEEMDPELFEYCGVGTTRVKSRVAEVGPIGSTLSLSLLDRSEQVPAKSGINWWNAGGRPRNANEAYIALPKSAGAQASAVFGSCTAGTRFHAILKSGGEMVLRLEGIADAVTHQAKQISSDGDKTLLGKWLMRERLHLPEKQVVTLEDLRSYGRTEVGFTLIGKDPTTGWARVEVDF